VEATWGLDVIRAISEDPLGHARRGGRRDAAEHLARLDVEFTSAVDNHWDGTTIFAKNADVSRYDFAALRKVHGPSFAVEASRWGRQRSEWVWDRVRGTGIPDELSLKTGALVMILSNDTSNFAYTSGDLGGLNNSRALNRGVRPLNRFCNTSAINGLCLQASFRAEIRPQGSLELSGFQKALVLNGTTG